MVGSALLDMLSFGKWALNCVMSGKELFTSVGPAKLLISLKSCFSRMARGKLVSADIASTAVLVAARK